jgi:hypothetical protein
MSLGTYGTGSWQVTMNIAESNTTAVAFASIPFYNNSGVGFATGWNQAIDITNTGAHLYELDAVSYKQFSTPQSGLTVNGDQLLDILGLGGRGVGLTVIADALVGAGGVSPSVDSNYPSSFGEQASNGNSINVGFGTFNANGTVVVAYISSETDNSTPLNVTSVTGGLYPWYKRASYIDYRSGVGQSAEIWFSVYPAGTGVEDYVNVTFDNPFDDANIIVVSWQDVNLTQPFTTSGVFTSNNNGGTPAPSLPTITITGGFSIVPNSGGGVGYWNLITGGAGYQPAYNPGDLTWPDHSVSEGLSDPNLLFDPTHGGTIYINIQDSTGTDQTTLLSALVGNSGTITFTQGSNHISLAYQSNTFTFNNGGGGFYSYVWDRYFAGSPNNMTLISTSNTAFTDGPVRIQVQAAASPTAHVYLPQGGIAWTSYNDDGNGHTFLSVGFPADGSGFSNPPQAGWKFYDDNGTLCTLRNDAVWFSGGAPSPYQNGNGWLCVVDRICTFNDVNPSIVFYENTPATFTINSADLNGLGSTGPSQYGSANGTTGFTVSTATNWIYNGVNGQLNNYTGIDTVYTEAGITYSNGYICNVIWAPGSSIRSGLAKVGYDFTSHQFLVQSIDPTDPTFLNNDDNGNVGTSLTGTFNFPAKFSLLYPIDAKGGWC